jgi:hypothetical protein
VGGELPHGNGFHRDMEIDAIDEWAGQPRPISRDLGSRTDAS